jgi:hypothetical protein
MRRSNRFRSSCAHGSRPERQGSRFAAHAGLSRGVPQLCDNRRARLHNRCRTRAAADWRSRFAPTHVGRLAHRGDQIGSRRLYRTHQPANILYDELLR